MNKTFKTQRFKSSFKERIWKPLNRRVVGPVIQVASVVLGACLSLRLFLPRAHLWRVYSQGQGNDMEFQDLDIGAWHETKRYHTTNLCSFKTAVVFPWCGWLPCIYFVLLVASRSKRVFPYKPRTGPPAEASRVWNQCCRRLCYSDCMPTVAKWLFDFNPAPGCWVMPFYLTDVWQQKCMY